MKLTSVAFLICLFISCGISDQVDQLKALKDCRYSIYSADSLYLAHTPVDKLVRGKRFNIAAAPSLMMALMQQKVPLEGKLVLKIENPGASTAGIKGFEYQVLIGSTNITEGTYDKEVTVQPEGGVAMVPLKFNTDLYPVLSSPDNQKALSDFFSGGKADTAVITLKVKPMFVVGNEKVSYPGYISMEKRISSNELRSFVKKKGY